MLIALLGDIHGNREALTACLAHAGEQNVERFLFLGDYVGYGADPGWAVDEVAGYVERGAVAIMGNHDHAVLSASEWMNATAQQAIDWTRRQLDEAQRTFLAKLPLAAEEDDRLFVHASAFKPAEGEYVLGTREAAHSFGATQCRETVCGHVHIPALFHTTGSRKVGAFTPVANVEIPLTGNRRWLAVIGSVGQPRDNNPAACYALLDDERDTLTYMRVPYDIETAARKIRHAGLPPVLAKRLEHGQ